MTRYGSSSIAVQGDRYRRLFNRRRVTEPSDLERHETHRKIAFEHAVERVRRPTRAGLDSPRDVAFKAMEFKTEAQKKIYEKTRDCLQSLFGEVNVKVVDETFALQEGSTFVYVRVFPIGDKKAGVEVFSYVVVDVPITEELMRYLLTYNLRLILGGFALSIGEETRGAVLLTHTILGDTMQREELYASVSAIARVADDIDDNIVAAFGGKTALGRLMGRKSPPEYWE